MVFRDRKWYIKFPIWWALTSTIMFVVTCLIGLFVVSEVEHVLTLSTLSTLGYTATVSAILGIPVAGATMPRKYTPPKKWYRLSEDEAQSVFAFCPDCGYTLNKMYCKCCDNSYKIVEKR